jgi:hypothetical protein
MALFSTYSSVIPHFSNLGVMGRVRMSVAYAWNTRSDAVLRARSKRDESLFKVRTSFIPLREEREGVDERDLVQRNNTLNQTSLVY